jgi:hypothetical protein
MISMMASLGWLDVAVKDIEGVNFFVVVWSMMLARIAGSIERTLLKLWILLVEVEREIIVTSKEGLTTWI